MNGDRDHIEVIMLDFIKNTWIKIVNSLAFLSPETRNWLTANYWIAWILLGLIIWFLFNVFVGGCYYDPYYGK